MGIKFFALLIFVSFLFTFSSQVHALDLNSVACSNPVTLFPGDDNRAQSYPQSNGRFVVWNDATSLFLYDIGTDGLVHTNDDRNWNIFPYSFDTPAISYNRLAFYDFNSSTVKLCELWIDCMPGINQSFTSFPAGYDPRNMSLDKNILVWKESQTPFPSSDKLVVQNLANGTSFEIFPDAGMYGQLRGIALDNYIVIEEMDSNTNYWAPNQFKIKIFDIQTGLSHTVLSSPKYLNLYTVAKYGDKFVITFGHVASQGNSGVYYAVVNTADYRLMQRRKIGNTPPGNYSQALHQNRTISAIIDGYSSPFELKLYDYRSGAEKSLYTSPGPLFFGNFENDKIVFTEWTPSGPLSFSIKTKIISCSFP